jgi:hypothetical protein
MTKDDIKTAVIGALWTFEKSGYTNEELAAEVNRLLPWDTVAQINEENRHLKDMLANLSKTHAKDMRRLSDMIDFRDNAIRKMREAKGRYHTELAARALFEILPENVNVEARDQ